jgi:hypothetical protein
MLHFLGVDLDPISLFVGLCVGVFSGILLVVILLSGKPTPDNSDEG